MNKTIIVTGASSGIGYASVKFLCEKGYRVFALSRNIKKMQSLEQYGACLICVDLQDELSIKKAIQEITKKSPKIDVLINNAGYGSYGAFENVSSKEARAQFEVNIFGLATITKLIIPLMRKEKKGTIINVSSIGGKLGEPLGSWYHASKFALEGLSDSLRMELKGFNIKVVVLEPGAIKTSFFDVALEKLADSSKGTAYQSMTDNHIAMLKKAHKMASNPAGIAKVFLKIIKTKNPKTRYSWGKGAKFALFLKFILSDKMFDTFMLSFLNYYAKKIKRSNK